MGTESMIAALRRERAVYVDRGQDDRVAQVDEQLAHYGAEVVVEPQGRTGSPPGQQVAAAPAAVEPVTPPAAGKSGGRGGKAKT